MADQTNQSILDAGLIIPKEEIIEDVEITFEANEDNKEFIEPKEELSNSSSQEDDYDQSVMPIKTELTLSKEIGQIRSKQETLDQGEFSGYIEVKSARRRRVPLFVETERVIWEVRRRPALWDLSDPLYKDRDVRAKLWAEVLEELFPEYCDAQEYRRKGIEKMVQKRWKTARDAYIRCRNIIKNNPASESSRKKVYVYFDDMRFLDRKQSSQHCDNRQASAINTDASTSNNGQKTPNHYTTTSKHDTSALNCDTSTSNRNTSVLNSDTLVSNHDTSKDDTSSKSSCDKTTPNDETCMLQHDTSNCELSMSNYYTPGLSNCDTLISNDPLIMSNCEKLSNQGLLEAKSLDLNVDTASTTRVSPTNHTNNNSSNRRLRKGQRKRKQARTDDFEEEMLLTFTEHAKLLRNDDLNFFMSLLPITKAFTIQQKLIFRYEILKKAMEIENMNDAFETKLNSSNL